MGFLGHGSEPCVHCYECFLAFYLRGKSVSAAIVSFQIRFIYYYGLFNSNFYVSFYRDLNKMADGIGSKLGRLIFSFVAFISAYILGFTYLWKMTLVMLAFLPLVAISAALIAKVY